MKQRSTREWGFAAIAWLMVAMAIVGLSLFAAATQFASTDDPGVWLPALTLLLGPALVIGGASLAIFGWRGRIQNALLLAGYIVGVVLVTFMFVVNIPGMLHGPRSLVLGSTSGTIAEVAERDAAWVELTPAFVDVSQIGTATSSSMDKQGRTTTWVRYVAPIRAAHGERDPGAPANEAVVMYVCDDDEDDVRAAATTPGTVAGRMQRADALEVSAIAKLQLPGGPGVAQCVVPGGRGSFWIIAWVVLMLAVATAGSALMLGSRARG